jgi:hypothetical protein
MKSNKVHHLGPIAKRQNPGKLRCVIKGHLKGQGREMDFWLNQTYIR